MLQDHLKTQKSKIWFSGYEVRKRSPLAIDSNLHLILLESLLLVQIRLLQIK